MTDVFFWFGLWGLSGVTIAWLMHRNGHNFWINAFIGLGYGPLLSVIWLQSRVHQTHQERSIVSSSKAHPYGWLDAVVGLDGSEDGLRSVKAVVDLLGPSIRRLRLASVLDHELTSAADHYLADERRIAHLREAATVLGFPNAEISLLAGRPSKALAAHAAAHEFDILIVAHHHRALTGAFLGSTVQGLARSTRVPVLIGPAVRSTSSRPSPSSASSPSIVHELEFT